VIRKHVSPTSTRGLSDVPACAEARFAVPNLKLVSEECMTNSSDFE
jgi:hypothetical protein